MALKHWVFLFCLALGLSLAAQDTIVPPPVDPVPVEPAPVDPVPVDPAPVDPAPVDPGTGDPGIDNPAPAPVDPGTGEPVPVDPGYEPAPVDPSTGQPYPVDPGYEPAPVDPSTGSAPAPAVPGPGGPVAPAAAAPQIPVTLPWEIDTSAALATPWKQEITGNRVALEYSPIREADVFWYRTVWRTIDCREKMNMSFKWPDSPLIEVLIAAAQEGEVTVYSGLDDDFKLAMEPKDVMQMAGATTDTVYVPDPVTGDVTPQVVTNEINWENVNKYRIKEIWFFDKQTSTMNVRIMGISPILESYDENGNYRGDLPLFWAYFPQLRDVLVKTPAYNPFPYGNMLTWDDIFALRLFSSYVIKEDNVRDYRIQDYATGLDALYESERVKNKLFTFEHDLWSF